MSRELYIVIYLLIQSRTRTTYLESRTTPINSLIRNIVIGVKYPFYIWWPCDLTFGLFFILSIASRRWKLCLKFVDSSDGFVTISQVVMFPCEVPSDISGKVSHRDSLLV